MTVRGLLASFAVSTLTFALPCNNAAAQRPLLTSHVPAVVAEGKATRLRTTEPDTQLELTLSLPLRNEAELDTLLADLYNPASPNFHHWLSSPEFEARFGALHADTQTLVDWARSKDLTVTYVAENGRLINVQAAVRAINRAFNVTLHDYRNNLTAHEFHAPDREPTVDLALSLLAISNLENSTPKIKHTTIGKLPSGSASNARRAVPEFLQPNGTVIAQSGIQPNDAIPGSGGSYSGYYIPSDMRAAYYGSGSLNGSGQTVGIFSYDGYAASDLTGFYTFINKTTTVPVSNILVGGYSGACTKVTSPTSANCEDDEQIADIVAVQGMVPSLSSVRFYEATSSAAELNLMASENVSKVITSSWSGGDFGTNSDTYFKQMATQGQTYLNATGDFGGYNNGNYGAPGVDPYITEVGGTDLGTVAAGGAWSSETGWTGSSGGFESSAGQAIPNYQQTSGVITVANGGSNTYRNAPDIAADANQDSIGYSQLGGGAPAGAYVIGGTSLATPRYAGYLAMANQQSVANGGTTVGFINPALYALGEGTNASVVFHDVTSGSNASSGGTPVVTYNATAGYDLVTGWGSPKGTGLINALAPLPGASFTLSAPTAATVVRGAAGSTSVTIAPTGGFTGAVALSASGMPTGVTAAFNAPSATASSTVTFTVPSATPPGTYTITINGASDSIAKSTTATLNVLKRAGYDFTISSANATLISPGSTGSTTTLTYGSGFSGDVALSVSGLPSGVTGSFVPVTLTDTGASNTGTSVLTLTAAAPVAGTQTTTVTVTGTSSAGLVHTATFTLTQLTP